MEASLNEHQVNLEAVKEEPTQCNSLPDTADYLADTQCNSLPDTEDYLADLLQLNQAVKREKSLRNAAAGNQEYLASVLLQTTQTSQHQDVERENWLCNDAAAENQEYSAAVLLQTNLADKDDDNKPTLMIADDSVKSEPEDLKYVDCTKHVPESPATHSKGSSPIKSCLEENCENEDSSIHFSKEAKVPVIKLVKCDPDTYVVANNIKSEPACSEIVDVIDTLSIKTSSNPQSVQEQSNNLFQCQTCCKQFRHERALSAHLRHSHKKNKSILAFHCDKCDVEFDELCELIVHVRSHIKTRPSLETQEKSNGYSEPHGEMFGTKERIENHCNAARNEKPFKCATCNKAFKHYSHLKSHEGTHINDKTSNQCNDVDNQLKDQSGIKMHTPDNQTLIVKNYDCKTCSKSFVSKLSLMVHSSQHSQVNARKLFWCHVCNESFCQSTQLYIHYQNHLKGRPYHCSFCDKKFNYINSLVFHIRSHTGEKPYQCDTCHRGFAQKGDLKSHYRQHTGDKPFLCQVCGRNFRRAVSLKRHTWRHTGASPYRCESCGKRFGRMYHLRRHQDLRHRQVKTHVWYKCFLCKSKFTHKTSLRRHFKLLHAAG